MFEAPLITDFPPIKANQFVVFMRDINPATSSVCRIPGLTYELLGPRYSLLSSSGSGPCQVRLRLELVGVTNCQGLGK